MTPSERVHSSIWYKQKRRRNRWASKQVSWRKLRKKKRNFYTDAIKPNPTHACMLKICFPFFCAVPNRFKNDRMNALETLAVFISFYAIPNRFKYVIMHALVTLFFKCSLHFQIVLNTVRMHAFETMFFYFLLAFPNRFKYRYNACYRDTVFICLCCSKCNRFKYVTMHALVTLFSDRCR